MSARRAVRPLRRVLLWIPVLLGATVLSGCWDRVEVSDLAILVGLGIDQTPEGIEVTAQVINATQSGKQMGSGKQDGSQDKEQPFLNYRERGATLQEAIHRFYRLIPRRLFVSHNTVVVFGRQFAEQGFQRALDYLERDRNFRRSQLFLVTSGSARDLLSEKTGLERLTARGLRKMVDLQTNTSGSEVSIELRVMNELLNPSGCPTMAWVDPDGNTPRVKGLGLFRGDRLVDLLPFRDARGLLWILGKAQRAQVSVPCPHGQSSGKEQKISVSLLSTAVDIDPEPGPAGPIFRVRLRGDGEVHTLCPGETLSPASMHRWSQLVEQEIQREMERTVERLKEKNVDAAQFGTRIFRKDPAWWRRIARQWPDLFQTCQVQYDVHIHLLRAGMISHPPQTDYTPENYPPRRSGELQ
ncbi:MAG: Ger(x)C family spore germination protein [Alicyclobacillaceae bacterium]|nr:Ger(x)C family spore germination protein [Alicyclobacillaceae bacterium]